MAKESKKEQDLGYTLEQIEAFKDYLKTYDFTKTVPIGSKVNLTGKQAEVFNRARGFFSQYWLKNLEELGIKRMMKNYSMNYPVKLLQNVDADYFSKQIAKMSDDPEKLDNAFNQFFEMFEESLCQGMTVYCKKHGKELEDLTDDETVYIVEKVADLLNEELVKVLMLGQQVPEIYGITAKTPAHEDFEQVLPGNYDLINFHNKWTHCKARLGAPILMGDLSEEETTGIEGARSFFESADDRTQKEYEEIRDAFADTLDSTDREIYNMREKGYTQADIAQMLGYKTHSAVTKRLKTIREKFDEFCGKVEKMQKRK